LVVSRRLVVQERGGALEAFVNSLRSFDSHFLPKQKRRPLGGIDVWWTECEQIGTTS
jgi:hypothetical protein